MTHLCRAPPIWLPNFQGGNFAACSRLFGPAGGRQLCPLWLTRCYEYLVVAELHVQLLHVVLPGRAVASGYLVSHMILPEWLRSDRTHGSKIETVPHSRRGQNTLPRTADPTRIAPNPPRCPQGSSSAIASIHSKKKKKKRNAFLQFLSTIDTHRHDICSRRGSQKAHQIARAGSRSGRYTQRPTALTALAPARCRRRCSPLPRANPS